MRRDELSRRILRAQLAPSRSHIAIFGLAISQLRHHLVFTIENTHLAIKIRANHPLALCMKIAGHAHVLLIFDCLQVSAIDCKGLNSSVAAIGHGQNRSLSARIDPKTMRSLKLSIPLPGLA